MERIVERVVEKNMLPSKLKMLVSERCALFSVSLQCDPIDLEMECAELLLTRMLWLASHALGVTSEALQVYIEPGPQAKVQVRAIPRGSSSTSCSRNTHMLLSSTRR